MDPMTALSLAASVVQFVQFATTLLNGTRQIYSSSAGTSEESERLEFIHHSLSDFCSKLDTRPGPGAPEIEIAAQGPPGEAQALGDLASRCGEDCKALLGILEQVKAKNRPRPKIWKSFCAALAEVVKANEIQRLQHRVEGYQRMMVVHMCAVSSGVIHSVDTQVRELRTETLGLHERRFEQLGQIAAAVDGIQKRISDFVSDQHKRSFSAEEVESLTTQVSQLSLNSKLFASESKILKSLHYEQIKARYESIMTAHERTLGWIFSNSGPAAFPGAIKLTQWLKGGQGVFWLSGRPGSGKSTLMKFIASHAATERLLSTWGGTRPAIKICYFFWSPGSELQRSQEGLLRSLLYDILSQDPKLIGLVCPRRWNKVRSGRAPEALPWSLSELQETVSRFCKLDELPLKYCFFIDGLDEFSGDHMQLCRSLWRLAQCPAIKVLASSRPWNIFEESFGKDPEKKLYLHDLTEDDIRGYTESRLVEHPNWANFVSQTDKKSAEALIGEIAARSHGVFLWVFLVTRMLRSGLTNYDTISELRERLYTIPDDLENFFVVMLESVEPFYHTKMAGTLQLALIAQGPLPVTVYSFHDLEYEDPEYASQEPVVWKAEEFRSFDDPFSRRLNSRCKGLLEVQYGHVEFLHRTVRDFLRTAKMRDFLATKAPAGFDASLSLVRAYAAWIKHHEVFKSVEALRSMLDKMLSYAYGETPEKNEPIFRVLDDVEWSLRRPGLIDQEVARISFDGSALFRQRILVANLVDYLEAKLDQDASYLDSQEIPPLELLFGREAYRGQWRQEDQAWPKNRVRLLHLLLERGHDPNQEGGWYEQGSKAETPWVATMQHAMGSPSALVSCWNAGVVSLFLDYGADVSTLVNYGFGIYWGHETMIWIRFLRAPFDNLEWASQRHNFEGYIHALDAMLAKAHFDTPFDGFEMENDEHRPPPLKQTGPNGGKALTARKVMFQLIPFLLRNTCVKHSGLKYATLQFYARVIRVFLRHAAHPSVPLREMRAVVSAVFPPVLSGPLTKLMNNLEPDESFSENTRKRGPSSGEGDHGGSSEGQESKRRKAEADNQGYGASSFGHVSRSLVE